MNKTVYAMKKTLLYILSSLICNTAISQNIMNVEQHSFKSTTYKEKRSFRIAVPASAYPNVGTFSKCP